MKTALTCAVLIAKMALRDGVLDPTERVFLEEMCEALVKESVERVITLAEETPLDDLIGEVEKYEDRFFIAARAFMMAHVDDHYDDSERAFFEELIVALEINDEDRALIESLIEDETAQGPFEPPARIKTLYEASSFYREDEPV